MLNLMAGLLHGLCFASAAMLIHSAVVPAQAEENAQSSKGACDRSEFETVVEDSAQALRKLNLQNKPLFQARLRRLKELRGWTYEAFLENAAPFVRDETIAVFDRTSEDLLKTISQMGQQGAAQNAPDCTLLIELKARMRLLVETQKSKWTYMFEKIDNALGADTDAQSGADVSGGGSAPTSSVGTDVARP